MTLCTSEGLSSFTSWTSFDVPLGKNKGQEKKGNKGEAMKGNVIGVTKNVVKNVPNKDTYLDNRRSRVQPKTKAPKASIEVARVTQGSQWLGEKIALPEKNQCLDLLCLYATWKQAKPSFYYYKGKRKRIN